MRFRPTDDLKQWTGGFRLVTLAAVRFNDNQAMKSSARAGLRYMTGDVWGCLEKQIVMA